MIILTILIALLFFYFLWRLEKIHEKLEEMKKDLIRKENQINCLFMKRMENEEIDKILRSQEEQRKEWENSLDS